MLNEKWLKLVFLTFPFMGMFDFEQDLIPLIQSPRGNCYINGPCLVTAWRSGGFMETWLLWHATVYTLVSSSFISFYDHKTEKHSKRFTSNGQYMRVSHIFWSGLSMGSLTQYPQTPDMVQLLQVT